jgi:holo-[acyl-carrier protein] synthase
MEMPDIPPGTNVVGVGIDQIEVSRIRDSLEKHGDHFLNKIFSENEHSYCQDKADPAPCLAARFAAKEAISKALGTGFGPEFGWLDYSWGFRRADSPTQ